MKEISPILIRSAQASCPSACTAELVHVYTGPGEAINRAKLPRCPICKSALEVVMIHDTAAASA